MIHRLRVVPLLATGATIVGAIDLVVPRFGEEPEQLVGTPLARAAATAAALLAALIIALPGWRWWMIVSRTASVAMVVWSGSQLSAATSELGTGLLACITLISVGSGAMTLPATRGRWPSALATSSVLGLTLYAMMDPQIQAGGSQAADRFADIPFVSAIVLSIAAFALLAQAWSDAPARSLHMPRWIGLTLTITCMAFVFVGWHHLLAAERADREQQAKVGTQSMGLALQTDLRRMIADFESLDDAAEPPTSAVDTAMVTRFAEISARYRGVIALEWITPEGDVLWQSTIPSITHPGPMGLGPPEVRRQTIERAKLSGSVAVGEPIAIDGRMATLIAAVPPDARGAFVALVDMKQMMDELGERYEDSFDAEVYYQERLLCEVDALPNDPIKGGGFSITIGGLPLILRAHPNRTLFGANFSSLPNYLLASALTASMLIGLTAFFAQTSAHKANLSAEERSKLSQLIEGARQVAIVATDPDGIITIFNHGAERLTGIRAQEVLGHRDASTLFDQTELASITQGVVHAKPFDPLALIAREQRAHERDWKWPRPDGGSRQVNLAANAWRSTNGELLGYMFVAVDVTEREAAMRALDSARRQSETRSQRKSSFLASVSHEVRNPMTAILSCTDLLLDATVSEEERRELTHDIRKHGKHLLEVLNDILDITKIEAGQLRIEMIEVKVLDVVTEAVGLQKSKAREKGLALTVASEGDGLDMLVRTDQMRVRQILLNLIGNALKFTERGEVAVTLKSHLAGGNAEIAIAVRDTGIGIRLEKQRRIFESFEQAESSTTRRYGGSGLGLAISQRLAELLEGKISVESEVGAGSVFTFRFTARLGGGVVAADQPTALDTEPARLDGSRVLVVDDSPDNQRLLSTILRRAGADVESAENGIRALEAIARSGANRPFDVILMDMQMPELDGYSTVRRLRASGYRGRIIALTGNATSDDRDRCVDAGCDDHAVKPIARTTLLTLCTNKTTR